MFQNETLTMEVGNLLNYYNTLFGIEIAIFGIISAVILVFIQLIYSNYSYKHISHILTNHWLLLYFLFSTIDLFITSAGSYFLSLDYHNIVPGIYFATDIILMNQFYSLFCLLLIFISIFFFIILIVKDITYLQPHRAIFLLLKNTTYDQIRDFLWKKYGLEPPYNLKFRFVNSIFNEIKKPKESKRAKEARLKKEYQEEGKELKGIETKIEAIKNKVKLSEDPLLPIRDMMIQFTKKSDLSSLQEASTFIETITRDFLKSLPPQSKKWQPEATLVLNYTKHLIESFETVLEIVEKEQLETAKRIVMETSYKIANLLFDKKQFEGVDKIEEFWQRVADISIGKSSILFQNIIEYYRKIGDRIFKLLKKSSSSQPGEIETILENLFRYIGWLGERLLIKIPFEESPLFMNYKYDTEYGAYYNCLLSFGDYYSRDNPNLYPLIYFDALFVVAQKLIKIYVNDKKTRLYENIFSIAYEFSSFAESAIKVNNGSGASIATIRIKEVYHELKRANLDKEANDVIKLLVKIGMLAAGYKLKKSDFMMGQSLDKWIIDELFDSNEDISSEVLESHIKSEGGDDDLRWNFITMLGIKMGTNFGLMFDPVDGKLYSKDDPRRR